MEWFLLFSLFLNSSSAFDFNLTGLLQTEYGIEWSPSQPLCEESCQPEDCQWSASAFSLQSFLMSTDCVCHADCLWSGTCCMDFEEVCFPVFSRQNISHPGLRVYMEEKALIADEVSDLLRLRSEQRLFECSPLTTVYSTHSELLIRCPSFTAVERDIVELCENTEYQLINQLIPVIYNGRAYKNIYCVQCFNISLSQLSPAEVPPIDVQCRESYFAGRENGSYSEASTLEAIQGGECQIIYHEIFNSVRCSPKGRDNCDVLPPSLKPAKSDVISACRSFQEQIKVNYVFYVNIFCAICNEHSIDFDSSCPFSFIIRAPESDVWRVTTFSVLLDFFTLSNKVDLTATRICDYDLEFLCIHDNECIVRKCPHEHYLLGTSTCAHVQSASFDTLHDNTTRQSVFLCLTCKGNAGEDLVTPSALRGAVGDLFTDIRIPRVKFDDFPCHHNYTESDSTYFTQGYHISADESDEFDSTLVFYALNNSFLSFLDSFKQEIVQITLHDSVSSEKSLLVSSSPQLVFSQPIYASLNDLQSHTLNMTIFLPELALTLSREHVLLSVAFVQNPITDEWEAEWRAHFNASLDISCDDAKSQCVSALSSQSPPTSFFQQVEEVLTLVLNALSIVCLFSSQMTSIFNRPPNQPINSLYDILRVSLMVAHLLFLLTGFRMWSLLACTVIAALQHCAWLVSFFTMNALAVKLFNVFIKQWSNVQPVDLAPGYILHAFCGPLCIVAACSIGHSFGWFLYGQPGACWIVGGLNVLIAFGLPVFVLLLCNAVLCITVMVSLRNSLAQSAQVTSFFTLERRLKIYVRVVAVMGFSWLSGILINIWSSEYLRILFTLFTCSNGSFVALCFASSSQQSSS